LIAYLNKNSDDPLPIPAPREEPAAEETADESAAKEADTGQPEVFALLATADAAKGDQAAALCKACHSFEAGGANMVG
nr:cytochrome c family protein [Desulfuromonadales bacterium]